MHQRDVLRTVNSAFSNHQTMVRESRSQIDTGLQTGSEGVQIPVINANQIRIELQSNLQLSIVMHLNQNIE